MKNRMSRITEFNSFILRLYSPNGDVNKSMRMLLTIKLYQACDTKTKTESGRERGRAREK